MNILLSAVASVLAFVLAYNYVPLDFISFNQPEKEFGSTITVIAGTDTLSASRSVINTNFSNLNTDKLQSGDTASTLTVGTLTLTNALAVASGGTASTSLSLNGVILGNTTSGFKTVTGHGASGQFLTSGGAGAAPTWTTSAIDTAASYTWTGHHIFSSLFSTLASTTHATTTNLAVTSPLFSWNGINFRFAGAALNTVYKSIFRTTSDGTVTFGAPPLMIADGTSYGSNSSASSTVYTAVIPAGYMGVTDGLRIGALTRSITNNTKGWAIYIGNGTASSTLISYAADNGVNDTIMRFEAELFNNNSASTQWGYATIFSGTTLQRASSTNTTINTANQWYVGFEVRNVDNDGDQVPFVGISIEKLTQ